MDNSVPVNEPRVAASRPKGCDGIGLVLQGGGALGAYQAGVYQGLHEAGLEPDWVAGVSIGAINAALIAGNPPERRLERLGAFWDTVTAGDPFTIWPAGDTPRKLRNQLSASQAMMFGTPGFFEPNGFSGWMGSPATSLYNTAPLRATLEKLVDFSRINDPGKIRFAVGAVHVTTANFAYFDNSTTTIAPEHIMASGALPPALPMIRIGSDHYWDGGLVSNTPLQHLLDNWRSRNMLVFQVDLFSANGALPKDLAEVMSRAKDIQYSSRTRTITDHFTQTRRLQQALFEALCAVPEDRLSQAQRQQKVDLAALPQINILQLIYRQKAYESDAKDYEFSRLSMRDHWQAGYRDTCNTLKHKDWLEMPEGAEGIQSHDIHRAVD